MRKKGKVVLDIAAWANVALAVGLFINYREAPLVLFWLSNAVAVVLAVAYIRMLRLDALEALKPICCTLILLFFVCPITFIVPVDWPYHPTVWVRGTRGLDSLITIALSIIYLIRAKKNERRKAGMVGCLIAGVALCLWCLVTMV